MLSQIIGDLPCPDVQAPKASPQRVEAWMKALKYGN